MGWVARITEFEWNSHFCDTQLKGPFASWNHRHGIVAESQNGVPGTLITDHVEYTLPLGRIGSMGHDLFVRRQMESTFAYRQQRIEEILPVAARQATRRA
jgi:ligand-binding SRPBCC domain-containing protein